jgi:glycosyltransferase involved in cell wall biosynthesis
MASFAYSGMKMFLSGAELTPTSLLVLVLTPQPMILGPIPKHSPLLMEALRRAGFRVVTRPWSRRGENESWSRKIWDRTKDLLGVVRLTIALRPDVVLVKTGHDPRTLLRDLPLVAALRVFGYPCVLQFHGSLPNWLNEHGHRLFKLFSRLLVRMSGTVLLLSSEECRLWRTFEPRTRYCLVSNPFVSRDGNLQCREESTDQSRGSPPLVLFVGRILREKGVLDLMQAFPKVIAATGAVLVISGDGPDKASLVDLADELGISSHVHLLGYLTGDALNAAYESATVFAFPSWSEGFPTVLSEAMAAGLPIVTTAIRGALDHLREPENTLFVPPQAPDLLATAIIRLLTDNELAARMGKANREKVMDFAPDAVVGEYVDALEYAVYGSRSARRVV